MAVIEGVDYSTGRPSPSGLKAAGKRFAVRYGGPGSDGKHLHAAELAGLKAAGIAVVANAEGAAGGFKGTAAGKNWAQQAEADFRALGMPAGRPIYFSVDWQAGSGDWAAIDDALRGAASVIGAARVGVYGGYDTIAHCWSARTAQWFWQTYAWSGGRWHPADHMQQYHNGVTVAGADCDLDRAMVTDYGQWGITEEGAMGFIDTQAEFNTALAAAFANKDVSTAVARAVLGYDPGPGPDGKPLWPGAADPWNPGQTQAPGAAIGNILAAVWSKPDPAGPAGPVQRIAELKTMVALALDKLDAVAAGGIVVTPEMLKDAVIAAFAEMAQTAQGA